MIVMISFFGADTENFPYSVAKKVFFRNGMSVKKLFCLIT